MSGPKKIKLVSHKCLKLSSMLHPAFILPDLSMYFIAPKYSELIRAEQ